MALTKLTKPRARWATFKLKASTAITRALYSKLLDRPVSVKDFGALGDGTTDDTVSIQAAIDWVLANNKSLYFPAGVYLAKGLTGSTKVRFKGEGRELSVIESVDGSIIYEQGDIKGTWGTGGMMYLQGISFRGKSTWTADTAVEGEALVRLNNLAHVVVDDVGVSRGKSSGVIFNSLGYAHIKDGDFTACNHETLAMKQITTGTNTVTSTCISDSRMSTGLRSGLLLEGVYNLKVTDCELEDNGIPIRMKGNNYQVCIQGNYIEATRGDYDIDLSEAAISNSSINDNYLFGTPNISSYNFPAGGAAATPTLQITRNHGQYLLNSQINTEMYDPSWLKGSRANSGVVNWDACKALDAAQQKSQLNVAMELSYGASILADSTSGAYTIGRTVAAPFLGGTAGVTGYFTQNNLGRGAINKAATEAYALNINSSSQSHHSNALKCSITGGDVLWTGGLGYTMIGTPNATQAALYLRQPNVGGRSVNASGTVNASGADYAEYMVKCITCGDIAKGDICGIDKDGKLTDKFADALSFVVKSTDPSYVGGDTWHLPAGEAPVLREVDQGDAEAVAKAEMEFAELTAYYESEVENLRHTVDRVAFCGQVPVNTTAVEGDYIIPTEVQGKIVGKAVATPSFEEYLTCVGKVIKVVDGKPTIIVKVS